MDPVLTMHSQATFDESITFKVLSVNKKCWLVSQLRESGFESCAAVSKVKQVRLLYILQCTQLYD